jgi:hypothetical protein
MNGLGGAVEHPRPLAGTPPLVTRQFPFAAALLTACLLVANGGRAVEIPDTGYQNAQRLDSGDVAPAALPETRGRPSPEIPPIQPSPQPPSNLTLPTVPPPEAQLPLAQGPAFFCAMWPLPVTLCSTRRRSVASSILISASR